MAKNGKKSNKLAELGKERGYLTSDEISKSLSSSEIDSEDVNDLIDLGIDVINDKKLDPSIINDRPVTLEEALPVVDAFAQTAVEWIGGQREAGSAAGLAADISVKKDKFFR